MIARATAVTYRYPKAPAPALADVSACIEPGSFNLVVGPSAGGKSTFLRLFNGLVPQFHGGTLSGRIEVAGLDPSRTPARTMATLAAMVFQVPEDQSIADTVEAEIAFGMEQLGVPRPEMRRRIDSLAGQFALEPLLQRPLSTLSGGERQRVELAAVLALRPSLLLLDEPTSQLDPAGADAFVNALRHTVAGGDAAVLIAEHRTDRLFPLAGRALHVAGGNVRAFEPREAAATLDEAPQSALLARRLGLELSLDPVPSLPPFAVRAKRESSAPGELLLAVRGLAVEYGDVRALAGIDVEVREGEIIALVGPNGSGKTSLFRAVAGTVRAAGEITFRGAAMSANIAARTALAGFVPQDPTLAFYRDTLALEVATTLEQRRVAADHQCVLARWGLEQHAGRNPRDLSVGQQERAALATMLAHDPPLWLLDEPTRGADLAAHRLLARTLRDHAERGGAAIVATHDIESAARWATRVVALERGRVAFDLPVRRALGHDGPMPTRVARLAPGALTWDEVEPC